MKKVLLDKLAVQVLSPADLAKYTGGLMPGMILGCSFLTFISGVASVFGLSMGLQSNANSGAKSNRFI